LTHHRVVVRVILGWLLTTGAACAVIHHAFALRLDPAHPSAVIASVWSGGDLIARATVASRGQRTPAIDEALATHAGATLVHEEVIGEGFVFVDPPEVLALSLVPAFDGLAVTWQGRTSYVTPDDLLAHQAYDKGISLPALGVTLGIDVPLALALLAERAGTTVPELREGGHFRRVRVARSVAGQPPAAPLTASTLTAEDVRSAAVSGARFLARGVDVAGRFRFLVDAPSNRTLAGYDWPRHAGATYYLAQIAAFSGDPDVSAAALRAAAQLRDHAVVDCGEYRCVGTDPVVDVGSTALALIAFVEIARTKLEPSYAAVVPDLAAFLRSQQRSNGDLMHQYDREARRPVDVQLLYYTGEAALALSRAHGLLGDPRDLAAATRALAWLVGPGWSFLGSRYYFGEEHWTCQVADDLWDRAPSPQALDFCLRWQEYGRALQYGAADSTLDVDGAYGFGPFLTPRLTPVGSRTEAALATLDAADRAGIRSSRQLLTRQIRRSLALLVRQQLRPGLGRTPGYLLADPQAVDGALPGSQVDWQLRVDYTQHAGSAMLRWLVMSPAERP
jgi:hypothetical protein